MNQELPVLIDPSLSADPAALRAAWNGDPEAARLGRLELQPAGQEFTGFLELVVTIAVAATTTAATTAAAEAVKKVIERLLGSAKKDKTEQVVVVVQQLPGGKQAVLVQKK